MKTLITIALFLGFSIGIYGQAKISFDNTVVEYKKVKHGADGTKQFSFKNTGDKPLTIKKVSSTSHHLKVSKPDENIDPGNTGKIEVTYDTKRVGPIRRTITVYSNAENTPVMTLKIKGEIIEDN